MIYIIFVKLEVHTVTRYLSQMKRISIGERTHATLVNWSLYEVPAPEKQRNV